MSFAGSKTGSTVTQNGKQSSENDNTQSSTSGSQGFHFIDGFDTKKKATRLLIRRQAVRHVAEARKSSKTWGKQNLRQNMVVRLGPGARLDKTAITNAAMHPQAGFSGHYETGNVGSVDFGSDNTLSNTWDSAFVSRNYVPLPLPSSKYELMRIQYGLDFVDLSALTTFHIGRTTARVLHNAPDCLQDVLKCRQWSYFDHLPSRFGFIPCLDDASKCLARRVRCWLKAGAVNPDKTTISLHNRALRSLQTALQDPVECLRPEVLCAIQMMALHEVNKGNNTLWGIPHPASANKIPHSS